MASLNYVCLILFAVSAAKAEDNTIDKWQPKDILGVKLQKFDKPLILRSQNEVTDDKPKYDVAVANQHTALSTMEDHPVTVLRSDPQCPDFSDVLDCVKSTTLSFASVVNNSLSIFTEAFNKNRCHMSINPITTVKCFLRTFAQAYKQTTRVIVDISSFTNNVKKLVSEFSQYSSKCNNNWSITNTLQLIDLLTQLEKQIKF